MSVSKWAYTPWKCDGHPCPGDCDHCPKAYEDESDKQTNLISRADAIERIANDNVVGGMDRINEYRNSTEHNDYLDGISTAIATVDDLPSADAVDVNDVTIHYKPYPSADAVPHGRLIDADALIEKIDKEMQKPIIDRIPIIDIIACFPSADRPTEDYSDLPDIPRAYYEKIVGNMAHEINMLKEQLESADAVHGEWIDVDNEPYCECSVCGSYIDNLDDDYAFCPRCGARMKGGAE